MFKKIVIPVALAATLSGCVIIVGDPEKMEEATTEISCIILFGGIEFGCHHKFYDTDEIEDNEGG
ncbi:MAG: hypothetical protein HOB82_07615 [Alphaproteobacteria bacterium]|jgi:hypothetical protein|nr:hypothetical protein [Alphaproteobacteria bacterium]